MALISQRLISDVAEDAEAIRIYEHQYTEQLASLFYTECSPS